MLRRVLIPESPASTASGQSRKLLGPAPADAPDALEGALLETVVRKRKAVDWLISLAVHVAVVAAILAIPMFFSQSIDLARYETTYLAAPPAPFAPPPPPAATLAHQAVPRKSITKPIDAKLTMPIAIPKTVQTPHPDAVAVPDNAPDLSAGVVGGIPGGVPGGVPGGITGGIMGGTGLAAPPPPPPASVAASNGPLQVGGQVKAPQPLFTPPPKYPVLAQEGRIEGNVEIDAVIDKNGSVVRARAVDGPPLLIAAALNAVKQWKYQPTYLNGVPWPVEMTVNVTFQLS